jgi:uncharacterized membrane protein
MVAVGFCDWEEGEEVVKCRAICRNRCEEELGLLVAAEVLLRRRGEEEDEEAAAEYEELADSDGGGGVLLLGPIAVALASPCAIAQFVLVVPIAPVLVQLRLPMTALNPLAIALPLA